MITAVATVLNEADIIGISVDHLLASGVDHIYIALSDISDDGTRKILSHYPSSHLTVIDDNRPYHDQPYWTRYLSDLASVNGATWVLPFDADEFIYPLHDESIPAALAHVPANVNKILMPRWLHRDWDWRHNTPEQLPKVAWRGGVPITCHPGNHDVTVPGNSHYGNTVLAIRELSFRSYEHMAVKCQERVARIDPSFGWEYGTHQRVLAALTENELREAWAAMQDIPSVYDPIPVRA